MKNISSKNLNHSTRNEAIYSALKNSPKGLTRQELATQFLDIYGMEQISSATGALLKDNEIFVMAKTVNPKTGQLNEVLGLDYNPAFPKYISRKDEMEALKEQVEILQIDLKAAEFRYKSLISTFKRFCLDNNLLKK